MNPSNTGRRILFLAIFLFVAVVLFSFFMSSRMVRPPMALYLTSVVKTNGATEVHFRFENHPGNIAIRSSSLLAPNGRDWQPVADMARLRILNDWAVTVTPTNVPRKFVAEVQEQSTGVARLKDLLIMSLYKIQRGGDVTLHTGRKTFVTNDVPFVSEPDGK